MRLLPIFLLLFSFHASAAEIVAVQMIHRQLLMVHIDDGYVRHHQLGEMRSNEWVIGEALNVEQATQLDNYLLSSSEDAAYATAQSPIQIYRKSKPTDFTWLCQTWNNGCINSDRDHASEHWIYLSLPEPLQEGTAYELNISGWTDSAYTLLFNSQVYRSEAVHTNLLGYVPSAPEKFGYVYHWLGDGGGLVLEDFAGAPFHLIDELTSQIAFSGELAFRKNEDNQETAWINESPPHGNFLGATAYECDFSTFQQTGSYRLCVEGIGCSFPFDLAKNTYELPFSAVMNGLYQQRSGIELEAAYTDEPRPVPHHPTLTPGFAGQLVYSTFRYNDFAESDSPAAQKSAIDAAVLGHLDVWGWYQDAGDWDSYYSHTDVPLLLLWLYEMGNDKFGDAQLRLPEQQNGLPDLLDEALWLPRFHHRLRQELLTKNYGTGGVGGGRVFGDLWGGDELEDGTTIGSWQDVERRWVCTGEDPFMTFKYAGLAAHIAYLLEVNQLTDPNGVDWAQEAQEAYNWALQNTRAGDNNLFGLPLLDVQLFAAANLYRLTGQSAIHQQYLNWIAQLAAEPTLTDELMFALFTYTQTRDIRTTDSEAAELAERLLVAEADFVMEFARDDRTCRWAGNFWMPMLIGQPTTPIINAGVLGHHLLKERNTEKAETYRAGLYSTADYFLGNNPLNMSWIVGVGERYPEEIFNLDSWYIDTDKPRYGIVPYGPWDANRGFNQLGPWNHLWAFEYIYPKEWEAWPGHERWFEQRTAPLTNEYTVHQNLAPSIFVYGYLHALTAPKLATSTENTVASNESSPLQISPNPVTDILRIEQIENKIKQYRVFNLRGQLIMQGELSESQLSVAHLSKGTYILQLTDDSGKTCSAKFLVQ